MYTTQQVKCGTFEWSTASSGGVPELYEMVYIGENARTAVVFDGDSSTAWADGIVMSELDSAGRQVIGLIAGGGIGLVKLGATVTAGQVLADNGSGKADGGSGIASLSIGRMGFGIALAGGGDNDVIPFIMQPVGGPHTA